jgi:endonuclease/exonuclease/phosphatase family metal-dependent hydrolase
VTVDAETQSALTVMTMNVLSFDHADGMRRSEVLREGIRRLRPDVIALQETTLHSGHDQAADLLGEGCLYAHHSSRSPNGVGATLGSRWPVAIIQEVDLHSTPRVDLPWAAALVVEIELPQPFGPTLFVHHKPSYQIGYAREREVQAVVCAQAVEDQMRDRGRHVVLLGDFDDVPDSSSIRFWTGKQSLGDLSVAYRDAWSAVHPDDAGHTFTPINPLTIAGEMSLELGRRIDYIMIRCGVHGPTLEVADCQLAFDKPIDGLWASDHFGVLARLTVPAHAPGAWISRG